MKDEFVIGINYWPIDSAMSWWHRFDAGVVKEDFSRIRDAGLSVVRIFLLWEDFQPLPSKISVKVLDQLITVMEIGHEKGLRLIPTFFTGHMSGMNYLPPWMLELKESDDRFPVFSEGKKKKNAIRNFYIDREVIEAQKLFIREVSGALQGHPALWAWDLGNEPSNLILPLTIKEALIWLEEMVSELKKRDESVPVTLFQMGTLVQREIMLAKNESQAIVIKYFPSPFLIEPSFSLSITSLKCSSFPTPLLNPFASVSLGWDVVEN